MCDSSSLYIVCILCSYLHKNEIVHGNLSLASIFIQHNGAIKIGSGNDHYLRTVKSPNSGQVGDEHFVHCSKVVLC